MVGRGDGGWQRGGPLGSDIYLDLGPARAPTRPPCRHHPLAPRSRKTLIYLILTLNHIYPDYDFSLLRAHHFKKEPGLARVEEVIDTHLREVSKVRGDAWAWGVGLAKPKPRRRPTCSANRSLPYQGYPQRQAPAIHRPGPCHAPSIPNPFPPGNLTLCCSALH